MIKAITAAVYLGLLAGHAVYLSRAVQGLGLAETGYVDPGGYRFAPGSPPAVRSTHNARTALALDALRALLVLASLAVRSERRWAFAAAWSLAVVAEAALTDGGAYFAPVPWHFVLVPLWVALAPPRWAARREAALAASALAFAVALWQVRFGPPPDTLAWPGGPPWQLIAAACLSGPLLVTAGVLVRRAALSALGGSALAAASLLLGLWGLVPLVAAGVAACWRPPPSA